MAEAPGERRFTRDACRKGGLIDRSAFAVYPGRRDKTAEKSVYSIIGYQGAAVLLVAAGLGLWSSWFGASALAGGIAVLMPNAFFAWASTRRKPGGWLLVQGVVKFLFVIVLMAMAFRTLEPEPVAFFSGVITALVAHGIGSWRLYRTASGPGAPRQGVR